MTVCVCPKNWESSSQGYISSRSSLAECDISTICFVLVWRPSAGPSQGHHQGSITHDMVLATVGCQCWPCSWPHRGNCSPKGAASVEVSPWMSVTRQWGFPPVLEGSVQCKHWILLPSCGFRRPILSFLSLHFASLLPLFCLKVISWGSRWQSVWISEDEYS